MRPALLLFVILILPACASIDDSKKSITLDIALRQYERAMRWGEFQAADSLRRSTAASPADYSALKSVRVTGYDVVNMVPSAENSRVHLEVAIRYYNEFTMKERTVTDIQSWEYDPVNKSWFITTPLPAFK